MSMRAEGYNDTGGQKLFDVVRGMILFDEWTSLAHAAQLLAECDHGRGNNVGMNESIDIIRIKNRFNNPTSGGWADALVNFRFNTSYSSNSTSTKALLSSSSATPSTISATTEVQHICEIQIVHKMLNQVRKTWGAHASYSNFRTAVQLLEAVGESHIISTMDEEMRREEEKASKKRATTSDDTDSDDNDDRNTYVAPIPPTPKTISNTGAKSPCLPKEDSIKTLRNSVATFNDTLNELKSRFDSEIFRLKREISTLRRVQHVKVLPQRDDVNNVDKECDDLKVSSSSLLLLPTII
eukprot:CAMPEP_0197319566 /NCGR_PEP_ID=MMETSP0891-20130614/55489_1 /TAXON_ID=44058 ORGANISM="Aureoumbra lagunensis, Strain CCMP1510" /NCGR_SAMPLE_ID=MMETSP0891 /ASSEMBLY_ACC=CAM_ASM_000534 /LENGTH=295 /DNA_ID=CAMNT_0042810573 /DNA_START=209 /DNA_END=1097 /DNA_ORIENTATION=+